MVEKSTYKLFKKEKEEEEEEGRKEEILLFNFTSWSYLDETL